MNRKTGWLVGVIGAMAVVAAIVAPGVPAAAATYVVDQAGGDDAAAGTEAAPWKTLSRGVKDLKPGDTLTVNAGVYRETMEVSCRGTAEAPITIQAAPGAHVVITGADPVAGWKPCTPEIAAGHPLAEKIFYADVAWLPTALYDAKAEQSLACFPGEGWQAATGVTATTLNDDKALTQTRDCWKMAPISVRFADGKTERRIVTAFDPATHAFTLNRPLPEDQKLDGAKVEYRLEGRLPGIMAPGQWAWEPTGEQAARVFYMPTGEKIADGQIELPRRSYQMVLDRAAHVVVDGFDMGYGVHASSGDSVVSANAAGAQDGAGRGLVVRNCSMHHHERFGVYLHGCDKPKLQRCLIAQNGYGVMLAGNTGALIEECEIGRNRVDGFRDTYEGRGTVVRRCYIHHHFDSEAHPDNIQTHNDVKDILFDSNLLICGGQSVMMATTDGVTFRNNVLLGSAANMMICGHNSTLNATFESNTFALWASSMFAMAGGTGYKMSGNILVNGGGALFYGVPNEATCESDRNLFWVEPGHDAGRPWRGKGGSYGTLADLQKATPWEAHSEFKDPEFASAPAYVAVQNWSRRQQCTTERVVIRLPGLFKPGDHVETNFDGVARTVKAVEGDAVVIDPPMEKLTVFILLCNWKDKAEFKYDYKTPLGEKYGSTISVPGFMKGDFDGDGKRDVPADRQ